jgi:hypothetical protein
MVAKNVANGTVAEQAPAHDGVAVSKSDTALAVSCRAFWVGTAGDVAVKFPGNSTAVVLKNVAAGTLLPLAVSHIMSANTTAGDFVALY